MVNSLFLKDDKGDLGVKKNDAGETVITFRLATQYTIPGRDGTCKKTMTEKELAKALDNAEKIFRNRGLTNSCNTIQMYQFREALEKLQAYKLEHGEKLETPLLDKKQPQPPSDNLDLTLPGEKDADLGVKKNDEDETVITFCIAERYSIPESRHQGTKKTMTEKELAKAIEHAKAIEQRPGSDGFVGVQLHDMESALKTLQTYKREHGEPLETPSVIDNPPGQQFDKDKTPGIDLLPVKPVKLPRPGMF